MSSARPGGSGSDSRSRVSCWGGSVAYQKNSVPALPTHRRSQLRRLASIRDDSTVERVIGEPLEGVIGITPAERLRCRLRGKVYALRAERWLGSVSAQAAGM